MKTKKEKALYHKKWYARNKDKRRKYNTGLRRKKDTGFTQNEYDAKFIEQEGKCAICGRHQDEFKCALAADHCHVTRIKRGLLCIYCNVNLGGYEKFKEEINTYLDYYKQ